MAQDVYYRGGNNLKPRPGEVKVNPVSGLLQPSHGVSVFNRPDNLERFGGAYRVDNVPDNLRIIQRGRDPHHFEVVPAFPMPMSEYEDALQKVRLTVV
jgi:hypothetical protein